MADTKLIRYTMKPIFHQYDHVIPEGICQIKSFLTFDRVSLSLFVGLSLVLTMHSKRQRPSFLHHSQNPEFYFSLEEANSRSRVSCMLEILLVSELMSDLGANKWME